MSYRTVRTPQRARTSRRVGHYRRALSPEERRDAALAVALSEPILAIGRTGSGHLICAVDAGAYDEPAPWGIALADAVGHIANAYASRGLDPAAVARCVVEMFLAEIQHPTDKAIQIGSVTVMPGKMS